MKSVLIIDRSEIIATLFSDMFWRSGWRTTACEDAESAMGRLAGPEHYDVVIVSYNVPATAGVQLVRFIRALEHRITTAILLVTTSSEVSDEALAAGADEVLPRPVNAYALLSAVDRHAPEA